MKKHYIAAIAMIFSLLGAYGKANSQTYLPYSQTDTIMKIQSKIPFKAYPFPLGQVQLKKSIFLDAMNADVDYLKRLNPDRLLSQFMSNAGLKPKAKRYGGWESMGLAGHSLGHYLSACAMYYAATKDTLFLHRINYTVKELALCQKARGTGYVGAIPNEDEIFYKVALGDIHSSGFDLNGGWSPWYTVHKIMAGLMDAYIYCGNKQALKVAEGIGNWAIRDTRGLTHKEFQKMLRCEYGGMEEALVNLYTLTGNKKYLALSYRFRDPILDSLADKKDVLAGVHANTTIPKFIGSMRQYEVTGNKTDSAAATFFWKTVVHHHSYVTGGSGNFEYWGPADKLNNTLSNSNEETCPSYNMLKLTKHLFAINPQSYYYDYYERTVYNHILSTQNRKDGMTCYFTPLGLGVKKTFSTPFNTFTCCVGTSMENHVKYEGVIYSRGSDQSLYVNLFIHSVLNWKSRGVKVTMDTHFPYSDTIYLKINTKNKQKFPIRIRKPYWLQKHFSIEINHKTLKDIRVDKDGYFVLNRQWKNNDRIRLIFPMSIHTWPIPDNPSRVAFLYGPIVLAGDLGTHQIDPTKGIPVFLTKGRSAKHWIKPVELNHLIFKSVGVGYPHDVTFRPLYTFTNHYYSVYWDTFTPAAWRKQKKLYEEKEIKKRELEARTMDRFLPGKMQEERNHHFTGKNLALGREHAHSFRIANNGGDMQFTMKVNGGQQNSLILTYWGMDNRGRVFNILVDGVKVAHVDLNKYKSNKFYHIHYTLPLSLTNGKTSVKVSLQALPKSQAGPVYGVRMVKDK